MRPLIVMSSLWLAAMSSGLAVIYSTYESRQLLNELEGLHRVANELHAERSRYLLEFSTWAAYSRVEGEARKRLDMQLPNAEKIVIVEQ